MDSEEEFWADDDDCLPYEEYMDVDEPKPKKPSQPLSKGSPPTAGQHSITAHLRKNMQNIHLESPCPPAPSKVNSLPASGLT